MPSSGVFLTQGLDPWLLLSRWSVWPCREARICLRMARPWAGARGGLSFPDSAPTMGKGTRRNRPSERRAGAARSVPTWATGGCSLGASGSAPSSGVRGPPPSKRHGMFVGHRRSHLLPTRSSWSTQGQQWGCFRPWARPLPASCGPHVLLWTAEAKSVAGTWGGGRPALPGVWLGLSLAVPPTPLPGGFPGARVAGALPLGGISCRSLSPGYPVPARAASQHTLDKLDRPP